MMFRKLKESFKSSFALPRSRCPRLAQDTSGFTLVEMLIVITLIGFITAMVTGNVMARFGRAKVDNTKIAMRNLTLVLDDYKRECNFYPTTDQGLQALIQAPTVEPLCKNYLPEGYLKDKRVPKDSWDSEYIYESDGRKFVLKSFGADKKEGGEGNDKDLSSDDLE